MIGEIESRSTQWDAGESKSQVWEKYDYHLTLWKSKVYREALVKRILGLGDVGKFQVSKKSGECPNDWNLWNLFIVVVVNS